MGPLREVADGDGMIPDQCLRLVPALARATGSCPAGCGAQGKAQGAPFRPGSQVRGMAGRGERQ